ncbi:hypothetical protein ABI_43840 [Asticcacaulis biprosthecium C19]|uniref:Uncharacterized protein n=1 Tax=Asticcacaulis biprosthecium C19 TaxID=715226 RepID=F4QT88_9CAUL|nr:hypothetical protein ABI_43840 [Asticcacaulis biprosthecium C19]
MRHETRLNQITFDAGYPGMSEGWREVPIDKYEMVPVVRQ